MPHIDEGTLHALLDGALRADSPDRARDVEAHIERCPDCRARLDAAAELRADADRILADAAPEAAPDFDEVLARAGRAPGPGSAGRPRAGLSRQERWTRGAAWAASLVLALGTGYLIRDMAVEPGGADRSSAGRESEAVSAPAADAAPDGDRIDEPGAPSDAEEGSGQLLERRAVAQDAADEEPVSVAAPSPPAARARTPAATTEPEPEPSPGRAQAEPLAALPDADVAGPSRDELASAARAPAPDTAGIGETLETLEVSGARAAPLLADTASEGLRLEAGQAGDTVWTPVSVDSARAAVAGRLFLLPKARALEAWIRATPAFAVRTTQVLQTGVELRVEQAPAADAALRELDGREAARSRAARPDSVPAGPTPSNVARVELDGVVLRVSGPLPVELLEILAGAARPVP